MERSEGRPIEEGISVFDHVRFSIEDELDPLDEGGEEDFHSNGLGLIDTATRRQVVFDASEKVGEKITDGMNKFRLPGAKSFFGEDLEDKTFSRNEFVRHVEISLNQRVSERFPRFYRLLERL